jgi:hypothetical protein
MANYTFELLDTDRELRTVAQGATVPGNAVRLAPATMAGIADNPVASTAAAMPSTSR